MSDQRSRDLCLPRRSDSDDNIRLPAEPTQKRREARKKRGKNRRTICRRRLAQRIARRAGKQRGTCRRAEGPLAGASAVRRKFERQWHRRKLIEPPSLTHRKLRSLAMRRATLIVGRKRLRGGQVRPRVERSKLTGDRAK